VLRARVERLDRFVEGRFAPLRGRRVLDTMLLAEDDPLAPAYYAVEGAISFSGVHVGWRWGGSGRILLPLRGAAMRRLECLGPRRR
jgi:hypothetical protein